MDVDPVTIVAQILNFALLVFLLKRFLYRPILDAMDRREQTIADRLGEAKTKLQQAEEREKEYEERSRELEESKREVLEAAREEAHQRSVELHAELRERIEVRERQWRENLQRETADQLESFRDGVGHEILATVRDALADLANRDLDEQLLSTFLGRIDELSDEQVDRLRGPERPGPPLAVVTPRPLQADARRDVTARLEARFGEDSKFVFETDDELVAGVELRCLGHRLGWNVDDYLDALDKSVRSRLDEMTRSRPAPENEESDARHAAS